MKRQSQKGRVIGAAVGAVVLVVVLVLNGCDQAMPPESRATPQDSQGTPPYSDPSSPPTPDPPKVTVSDDVSVIDDSDIATVNENSVAFVQPVSYSAGDVIVAGVTEHTPAGMLRKVTAVSADGRTISTEPATLEDVVQDGTLVVSGELRESDLTPASRKAVADAGIVLSSERGLQPAASGGFAFGYDIPNVEFSQGSHSLQIDGSIRFSLDYDLQVDYRGGVIHSARFAIEPRQVVNLIMSAAVSAPLQTISGRKLEFSLFPRPLIFAPITVLVGPVPVVITPSFQVYAGVDATGEITVDVVQEGSVEIGVQCPALCHLAGSWEPIVDPSVEFRVNEAAVGAEIRGYVRPELSVKLYDVIGPSVEVEVFAVVGGRGGVQRNGLFGVAYLEAGISASAGVKVDVPILGTTLLKVTVLDGIEVVPRVRLWEWPAELLAGEYSVHYSGSSAVDTLALNIDGTASRVDGTTGEVLRGDWWFYPERRALTLSLDYPIDEGGRHSPLGSTIVIADGWRAGDDLCIGTALQVQPIDNDTPTMSCQARLVPTRSDGGVVLNTPLLQHDDTPASMVGTYRFIGPGPSPEGSVLLFQLYSDGTSDMDISWWYHEQRRSLTLDLFTYTNILLLVILPEGWDGERLCAIEAKRGCLGYLERVSS